MTRRALPIFVDFIAGAAVLAFFLDALSGGLVASALEPFLGKSWSESILRLSLMTATAWLVVRHWETINRSLAALAQFLAALAQERYFVLFDITAWLAIGIFVAMAIWLGISGPVYLPSYLGKWPLQGYVVIIDAVPSGLAIPWLIARLLRWMHTRPPI
jgi:hypothetical protein